jgi:Tfp pilus assembly protein PilV
MTQPVTRRAEAGFTLVSVILAIVILSIGLLALARAQAVLVKAQGMTANRNVALTIARDYTEVLRSRDPWGITNEAATAVNERGVVIGTGKYTRTVTTAVTAPNLLQVTISVTYPRGPVPIDIITLIYRGS